MQGEGGGAGALGATIPTHITKAEVRMPPVDLSTLPRPMPSTRPSAWHRSPRYGTLKQAKLTRDRTLQYRAALTSLGSLWAPM